MNEKIKIPNSYTDARLYVKFSKNQKGCMAIDTGQRNLVFYDENKATEKNILGEICSMNFIDFFSAYHFILEKQIEVTNILHGSYEREINLYRKEILLTGQLRLF